MNKPLRLRFVNQIVGVFVLFVAVALLVVIFLIGQRQEWGAPEYELHAVVQESELNDLRKGSEVLLLGQVVGKVEEIVYSESGLSVNVTFSLRESYHDQIYEDSVAFIRRKLAGAGDAYVEIMRGPRRERRLEDGEQITLVPERDPTQDLELVVQSMDSIREAFQDVRNAMVPAFDQMTETVEELSDTNEKLSTILNDVGDVSPRLDEVVDQTQEVLRGGQRVVNNLQRESEEFQGTSRQLQDGITGAQDVIDGLKRHWLLRRYVDQGDHSKTIPPAYVGRGGSW